MTSDEVSNSEGKGSGKVGGLERSVHLFAVFVLFMVCFIFFREGVSQ